MSFSWISLVRTFHTPQTGWITPPLLGQPVTSCLYLWVIPVITCDRCTARRSQRRHGKISTFVKQWNLSIESLSSCGKMQNRVNSNGLNCDHRKLLRLFWVICGLGSGPTVVLASVNQPEDAVAFSNRCYRTNDGVVRPQPCGNSRHTSLLLDQPVATSACASLTWLMICDRGASHRS